MERNCSRCTAYGPVEAWLLVPCFKEDDEMPATAPLCYTCTRVASTLYPMASE